MAPSTVHGRWLAAALLLGALTTTGTAAAARTVLDALDRQVRVPDRAGAVVSLAPNLTEILYAVGAGGQVAGVTDFCDFPPEAARHPRIGGFVNPSLEMILALRPDLVLATADGNRLDDVRTLERLGLPVFVVDTRSVEGVTRAISSIGDLTGRAAEAAAAVAALRRQLSSPQGDREGPRARVLFLVGIDPPVGVGPGTILHQLILDAGGENVLSASPVRYPLLGGETIMALDPDLIVLDTAAGEGNALTPGIAGWASLRAVRQGRVHLLRDDSLLRPGPRLGEGFQRLLRIVHGR
jgi:iron complex transport system substrate-binding protein